MLWYWIVFLSLLFFAFFEQFSNMRQKTANRICWIYTLFFIFLSTIRWNQTLGDWKGYYSVFQWEHITSLKQVFSVGYWPFEPLYYLAMRFINYLTGSYSVVLFFMASITSIGSYYAAAYLNNKTIVNLTYSNRNYSTILATFLASWAIGCASVFAVRTNMATAICLLSIKYIEQKKPGNFIFTVIIASMFHFAAIVYLVAYPLYHIKFSTKQLVEMLFIALVLNTIGLQRIIPVVGLLGGRYAEKVASYNVERSGNFSYQSYSTSFLTIRAVANTLLILVICLYIRKHLIEDKRFNGLFNVYVTGAFIQALTIKYNLEFARLAVFFINIQVFILPYIFLIKKDIDNRLVYFVGYAIFMGIKMYSLLYSAPGYAQFTTIFSM